MTSLLKTALATLAVTALPFAAAHAQAVSDADKEKAAENYLQADANADGALDRSEFETLINLNADDSLGRAATVRRFGRYDMAFSRADANGDGFVTQDEIRALAEQAGG